jgi:hypothetical protein
LSEFDSVEVVDSVVWEVFSFNEVVSLIEVVLDVVPEVELELDVVIGVPAIELSNDKTSLVTNTSVSPLASLSNALLVTGYPDELVFPVK